MADKRDAQNGLPYNPQLRQGIQSTYLKDVYKPLMQGQVRFIEIQGLRDDGVLQCKLVHKKLLATDAKPKYAIISYTWNPKVRITYGKYDISSKHIILDGFRTRIPDKAATILRLMLEHRRRRIWIDAICINQSDANEKAVQVQMMGDIYRTANEVAVILGPPSDLTDHFIDGLLDSDSALRESEKDPRRLNAGYDLVRENAYWTRAWTLQEISLARSANIFCGSRVVDFQAYYSFRETVETDVQSKSFAVADKTALGFLADAAKGDRRFNSDIAEERYQRGLIFKDDEIRLLELLRRTRLWHNCFDPRDKLFSRLALAYDAKTLIPHVDYRSSIESIFKSFAARCVLSTGSLEVITFTNKTKMTLPTWVPDWTSPSKDWLLRNQILIEALRSISWSDKSEMRVSPDDLTLIVRGMVLEMITASYASVLKSYITYFSPYHVPRDAYSWSEIPRKGDLICLLQRCDAFVFLRKVQNHFIMVGRFIAWQEMLERGLFPGSKISQICRSTSLQFNAVEESIFEIR